MNKYKMVILVVIGLATFALTGCDNKQYRKKTDNIEKKGGACGGSYTRLNSYCYYQQTEKLHKDIQELIKAQKESKK